MHLPEPASAGGSTVDSEGSDAPARRASWWQIESPTAILVILALINFLNYADRNVIAGLVPFLQESRAKGGLGLTSSQIGVLQGAFMIVHSLASIPLGIVADRYLRKGLIAIGVSVWSLATAAAGFSRSFLQIFVARASVGIGEATYAPAASALISERFDPAKRARAMGIFQLGMVLGGAVGLVLGGVIATKFGWRVAFFVVGFPGLLLAAVALVIFEPKHPRAAKKAAPAPADGPRLVERLRRLDTTSRDSLAATIWVNVAGILITFFTGAILIWGLTFVLRTRFGGDSQHTGRVLIEFGVPVIVAGILGTLSGSLIADRLERRYVGMGRLLAIAVGVFASAPSAFIGFTSGHPVIQTVALVIGVYFNTWYVGPILAALHDVVPSRLRGTATGVYLCLVHVLGDGISPGIVGMLDDATGSLRPGLLLSTGVLVLGGVAAILAMPSSRRLARLKHDQGGARVT